MAEGILPPELSLEGVRAQNIGRFWFCVSPHSRHYLPPQSRQRLLEIQPFYTKAEAVRRLVLEFRRQRTHLPSLRVLDWFVTNYCKKKNARLENNQREGKRAPARRSQRV